MRKDISGSGYTPKVLVRKAILLRAKANGFNFDPGNAEQVARIIKNHALPPERQILGLDNETKS